jgi:hypothetical protein
MHSVLVVLRGWRFEQIVRGLKAVAEGDIIQGSARETLYRAIAV